MGGTALAQGRPWVGRGQWFSAVPPWISLDLGPLPFPRRRLHSCAFPTRLPLDEPPGAEARTNLFSGYLPTRLSAGTSMGEPAEGELARFFGYSHDVLVILDAEGRVVVVSPSAERLLGYAMEGLLGVRLLDRVHPDDQILVKTQARSLRAGETVTSLDVRIEAADGRWVPMRWSLALGPGGTIYGVGRDRTREIRHREAQLSQEIAELRLRTAMELHDGILQTLTGAAFQIAVARRLVRQDPARAEEVLAALAKTVAAEQQEMRLYVDEVKGGSPMWGDGNLGLAGRIEAMLDRVSVIWGLEAVAHVRLPEGLSPETERRLVRITQEATVNAARHGGARSVSVRVEMDGREVVVEVGDDGHGFSFQGEFDDATLRERRLGPLSLKHRVAAAGGTLSILSTPEGATLAVRIPLAEGDLP